MKLFKKVEAGLNNQSPSAVQQRATLLDAPSLRVWLDTTIMGLGAAFDKWRYHNGPAEEVMQHIHAINALWAEVEKREENDNK
jgi:uncharacterized protein YgfB (UPF0149 family)